MQWVAFDPKYSPSATPPFNTIHSASHKWYSYCMNRFENLTKIQKAIVLGTITILVAIAVYGAAFTLGISKQNNINTETPSSTKLSRPIMTTKKPIIDKENKILKIDSNVATSQQGNCELTLSNKKNVFVLTNSTEGVTGRTGCLNWNIGTDSIPAGTYNIQIKFTNKTQSATTKQTVTIP